MEGKTIEEDNMKDLRERLRTKLRSALEEGLIFIKRAIPEEDSLFWIFKKHKNYPVISSGIHGFPHISSDSYSKYNYQEIFLDKQQYLTLPAFINYHNFIHAQDWLSSYFLIGKYLPGWKAKKDDPLSSWYDQYYTYNFLIDFVDAYVHRFSLVYDEDNFSQMFELYFNSIVKENKTGQR